MSYPEVAWGIGRMKGLLIKKRWLKPRRVKDYEKSSIYLKKNGLCDFQTKRKG